MVDLWLGWKHSISLGCWREVLPAETEWNSFTGDVKKPEERELCWDGEKEITAPGQVSTTHLNFCAMQPMANVGGAERWRGTWPLWGKRGICIFIFEKVIAVFDKGRHSYKIPKSAPPASRTVQQSKAPAEASQKHMGEIFAGNWVLVLCRCGHELVKLGQ